MIDKGMDNAKGVLQGLVDGGTHRRNSIGEQTHIIQTQTP